MEIAESRLIFDFDPKYDVMKFDECVFYSKYFKKQPHGKGIDMIAGSTEEILLIEVKNCSSFEIENRWRTANDKGKKSDGQAEESFDIEISKKVAMSISCLYGAHTKRTGCPAAADAAPYFDQLASHDIPSYDKRLIILFFLEGDFKVKTRSKAMIMKSIQDSIKKKLSWIHCKVQVVDSHTHADQYFTLKRDHT